MQDPGLNLPGAQPSPGKIHQNSQFNTTVQSGKECPSSGRPSTVPGTARHGAHREASLLVLPAPCPGHNPPAFGDSPTKGTPDSCSKHPQKAPRAHLLSELISATWSPYSTCSQGCGQGVRPLRTHRLYSHAFPACLSPLASEASLQSSSSTDGHSWKP